MRADNANVFTMVLDADSYDDERRVGRIAGEASTSLSVRRRRQRAASAHSPKKPLPFIAKGEVDFFQKLTFSKCQNKTTCCKKRKS
jgi:hypothetical protein